MKFILGKKIEMTQVFKEDGTVVPVTKVKAGPCVVTQVKTKEKDGVDSVQIGYGEQKFFRINKSQKGHLKNLPNLRYFKDFSAEKDSNLKRGDLFTVKIFEEGEKVKVTGKSKGRGFQGVVKRHGFHGSPATHGHKDQLRMPGSIGATAPQRVFKGMRMAGHMGDAQITVKNLEIIKIEPENDVIYLKGALPGARNGLVLIKTMNEEIVFKPEANVLEKEPVAEVVETVEKKEEKIENVPTELTEKVEVAEENKEANK